MNQIEIWFSRLIRSALKRASLRSTEELTAAAAAALGRLRHPVCVVSQFILSLPLIARRMGRHKSWVWRRLMLVEALEPTVQNDVRLGLIALRAAIAVSRLPRGNQEAASKVVVRLGLTVQQTEVFVEEITREREPAARAAVISRRLDGPAPNRQPGPRPSRAVRSEADWMSADILRVREISARLEARLLATPLEALTPSAGDPSFVRLSFASCPCFARSRA